MNDSELFAEIVAETRVLLEEAARGPRRTVGLSPEVAAALDRLGRAESAGVEAATAPVASGALAALREEVRVCEKCGLCKGRTNTVFGDGNASADIVFVGEAPGAEEDLQGLPFVGRAGQLLTNIIEKGMGISREEVYICNVLKCRPPGNRDPHVEEVAQCEGYLQRQLDLIKPKVICALGGYAAKTLLKTDDGVGTLRGKWHSYHGIPLRVTYHPSYLLRLEGERSREEKKKTWHDVLEVMKLYRGETTL